MILFAISLQQSGAVFVKRYLSATSICNETKNSIICLTLTNLPNLARFQTEFLKISNMSDYSA